MKRILRDERGMALAVAIFALVVVGALVAGAFFAGTQEQRVGENQRRVQTSFGVAEAGGQERIMSWDPNTMNRRPLYPIDSVAIGPDLQAPSGTGTYGGYSYRIGPNLFLIDVTGRDRASAGGAIAGGGGARQRIGMITRIAPIEFGIKASLTTQGSVTVSGTASVNGADQPPTGWGTCDISGPAQAGVRTDGGTVTTEGQGTVLGSPPVVNDPSLSDSSFNYFGGASYAQLAARANVTLSGGTIKAQPSVTNGVCDKSVLTNWGDGLNPTAPCGNYFPTIHITGNATLDGVQGQGILLVDGNLTVQGSFQFFGIVIVQGDLKTAGGGTSEAHFWGGVMAKNADLSVESLAGKATLNFSSCSILAVLQAQSPIAMMRSRGWSQLF
ncbi:MAG: pilus assembly PilX N-terminal domain-containing protein [Gemmatimonadales bacterium]